MVTKDYFTNVVSNQFAFDLKWGVVMTAVILHLLHAVKMHKSFWWSLILEFSVEFFEQKHEKNLIQYVKLFCINQIFENLFDWSWHDIELFWTANLDLFFSFYLLFRFSSFQFCFQVIRRKPEKTGILLENWSQNGLGQFSISTPISHRWVGKIGNAETARCLLNWRRSRKVVESRKQTNKLEPIKPSPTRRHLDPVIRVGFAVPEFQWSKIVNMFKDQNGKVLWTSG